MGVSTSLPYDMEEEVSFSPSLHWQLFHGKKKEEDPAKPREQVSIFKFIKSQSLSTSVAQRGIQRIRTIKHPYVLSFITSSEMEDSFVIVTESCTPISVWIQQHLSNACTESEKESLIMEILWGLKNILDACNFLHLNCKISHCFISPQSCFVTKNGDWKLGFMDLACDISAEADHFRQYESLLEISFRSPERVDGTWSEKYNRNAIDQSQSSTSNPQPTVGSSVDIFSLGKLIEFVFNTLTSIELPQCLSAPLKRMISPDHKRRPACSSLLRLPCFQSDQLSLMTSISELQLKPTSECVEVFKILKEKANVISRAACTFKILPSVGHSLTQAVNEFQNRDLRELSRQTVQASLDLLACLSMQKKVEEIPFQSSCLVPIQNLWGISDRSIRTSLLKTLKPLIQFFPKDVVNKRVFEPLIGGFSDSNAKLREETLKSLVHIVDKLDENQLQDKLVRCITSLQQDPENSIRTNATIFLSRIMPKLKESVRAKVLVPAYSKAMKDSFSHCRIAGLRATDACLSPTCLCDIQQLCGRLMPQVCLLLVDNSSDVRELALTVLESCTVVVRTFHKEHKKSSGDEQSVAPSNPISNQTDHGVSLDRNQSSNNSGSGWTSWAVDGFSKSLEKVALDATGTPTASQPGPATSVASVETPIKSNNTPKINDWGDDDLDFDDDPPTKPPTKTVATKQSTSVKPQSSRKENSLDEWDENPPSVPPPSKPKDIAPQSKKSVKELAPKAAKPAKTKEKTAQSTITKITTQTSDFDDWNDAPTAVISIQKPKSTSQISSTKQKDSGLDDDFDWGEDLDNIDLPPGEAWGAEDDLDLDLNVLGNNDVTKNISNSRISSSVPSLEAGSTFSTNLPRETMNSSISSNTIVPSSVVAPKPKVPGIAKKEKESTSQSTTTSSKKPPKAAPVVKKLAVSSEGENWDDF